MCASYFLFNSGLGQEFWVGNEELVNIYENRLRNAGYISFKLARTNNRGDGTFSLFYSTLIIQTYPHQGFLRG